MSEGPTGYPPELAALAASCAERVKARLVEETPGLAPHAIAWIESLSPRGTDDYFTHPNAFPMLLLPWWLDASLAGQPNADFQSGLIYSTMCGYYFVRMIDDLMDAEHTAGAPALPALIFFHTEFEQQYHRFFAARDPFWESLKHFSYAAADTASVDAAFESINADQFARTSARKVSGVKVPLAAVCHRHRRAELIAEWSAIVDLLGRWHQMRNDIVGWPGDLARGRATYFLSEAARRATADGTTVPAWVMRVGLDWGATQLDAAMTQLLEAVARLDSPSLVDYLERRQRERLDEWDALKVDLAQLERLGALVVPHPRPVP